MYRFGDNVMLMMVKIYTLIIDVSLCLRVKRNIPPCDLHTPIRMAKSDISFERHCKGYRNIFANAFMNWCRHGGNTSINTLKLQFTFVKWFSYMYIRIRCNGILMGQRGTQMDSHFLGRQSSIGIYTALHLQLLCMYI